MSDYIPQFYVDVIVYTFKIKCWCSTFLLGKEAPGNRGGAFRKPIYELTIEILKPYFCFDIQQVTAFLVGRIFFARKSNRYFTRFGSWADKHFVCFFKWVPATMVLSDIIRLSVAL